MKRKITVVLENHFDQIWRRCYKRDIQWQGQNFVSYEKLHKYYIEKHLEICDKNPGYKFQIETPNVLENYLRNHPEKEETIKKLYADGVIKTTNTGYVIGDTNMAGPETIIRNYLLADEFFKEFMGYTPTIANRADAFGSGPQTPQILKQFGANYVTSIFYATFDEDVWVGLDGSAICVSKHPKLGVGGHYLKYPPCPHCKGFGCERCEGKGIDLERGRAVWRKPKLYPGETADGMFRLGGEELMPSELTPQHVKELAEAENADIAIGHTDVLLKQYEKQIAQVEAGNFEGLKVHGSPEFNPNTTGGYVTHITIKKRLVEEENKLLSRESYEAMKALAGKTPVSMGEAWRSMMLCSFHDSAAGTVTDPAYEEIISLFDKASAEAAREGPWLFNGTSLPFSGLWQDETGRVVLVKDLAPYSFTKWSYEDAPVSVRIEEQEEEMLQENILTGAVTEVKRADGKVFTVENEHLIIEADDRGLRKITHKQHGVLSEGRPCQWLLQSDNGSAWATLEPPYQTKDLTNSTHFVNLEQGRGWQRLCYRTETHVRDGDTVANNGVLWYVTLADGIDRVYFHAEADWCAAGKRLMVRFPIEVENAREIYGVPGGWLHRGAYEPEYAWNGNNGDWCAHRFGGAESAEKSVALFNRGTPCYQVHKDETGCYLDMTVLRAPTIPAALHEPMSYDMRDYDGIRDEGHHSFEFALCGYGTDFANSTVCQDAEIFSRLPVTAAEPVDMELPLLTAGTAMISHVKCAEDGNGIIVRVTECGGQHTVARLTVPGWVREICKTDMAEKSAQKLQDAELPLHPFEIATLRFTP